MTTIARQFEDSITPPSAVAIDEARAFARRAVVYAFCAPHRVHLVGYATDLLGDERVARDVVERALDAMIAGRVTIPMTDTVRRLRAIVAEAVQ